MHRTAAISRGIRDAGISKSRKKYRIGTSVGHVWLTGPDARNMSYAAVRESALRTHYDCETYGWDAEKLLDYWESKKTPVVASEVVSDDAGGQLEELGGQDEPEGE